MERIVNYKNIYEMVRSTIDRYPDRIAYRWILNDNGETSYVTWSQFGEQASMVAKSLMKLGIKKGDRVNILSYTCYQWVLSDVGITAMGGCTVGIYHSSLSKDCLYIIKHSGARLIFVEDTTQLEKMLSIKKQIPHVKKVVLFNGSYSGKDKKWVLTFEEFLRVGKDISDKSFEKAASRVTQKDTAAIVYTSGTTGVPKGAMLTHDNFTFTAQCAFSCADIRDDDETFIFLPLAHIFARLDIYFTILGGVPTTFCRSMDTIIDDIKLARPHWFASVPRIFEKVYSKVLSGAESKGGIALAIFNWACNVGLKVSDRIVAGKKLPPLLAYQYKMATKLIFSKIQGAIGGRVRFCVSGAAPLNPEIARFFHGAGILICEGYGMTENMSFTNVNRVENFRFGTVGPPGPGIEQKIAGDGEILFRGRNVMKGYYRMHRETAAAITKDRWLHTGDLGIIDPDGFLRITGRKKDLIITSGGKNIAPSAIEGHLGTSKYINQICIIGDKRNYLTALLTLDQENIAEFARESNIRYASFDDLFTNREVLELIENEIAEKNRGLASFETIKKFTIVPEFTIDNKLITPTLKLKKNDIMEKYKKEIDSMYR